MSEQRTLLDQASMLLAQVAALPLQMLDNNETALVLKAAESAGRLLDGLRVTVAGEVAERSRFSLGSDAMCRPFGYTKASHYLEQVTRISSADAYRRISLGSIILPRVALSGAQLPPAEPLIAEAVVSGEIGIEAAGHLHRLVKKVSRCVTREELDEVLDLLIAQAKVISSDLVGEQVREWIAKLDTDGIEPREEVQRRRRAFYLGRESGGMTPFNGMLDPLSAGLVKAIFTDAAQSSQNRFMTDEDRAAGKQTIENDDGTTTVVEEDPRTREQRQLDIVMGTLKAGLRASAEQNGGMRSTVTVSVVVQLADMQKQYDDANTGVGNGAGFGYAAQRPTGGVGWIDGVDEPISTATVRQLLCDGDYQQILLGNAGEVLYLEHTHRRFSMAQRKALAVRDGGCVWPNCTVPAQQCDAHHVKEHSEGGPTHIDNGVLLCGSHHGYLHASDFTIKMIGGKPFIQQPFWLDSTQVWIPLGHSRGHVSATLTAQATLAAFESTAAALAAMADVDDTGDTGDTGEDGADQATGFNEAFELPLWYESPPLPAPPAPSASPATAAELSKAETLPGTNVHHANKLDANVHDATRPETTAPAEWTDPPEFNDWPDASGSLSENMPSYIVTPRKRRAAPKRPVEIRQPAPRAKASLREVWFIVPSHSRTGTPNRRLLKWNGSSSGSASGCRHPHVTNPARDHVPSTG